MESLREVWTSIIEFLTKVGEIFTTNLFELGESNITLGTIIYFVLSFVILTFVAKRFRNLLVNKILVKANMERGARNSIGLITRVMIMFVGSIFIIQSAGIDMSSLSLLAGALGVGIGFGLQNITDNFISGIIILFEKPIKVGDRIVVGDTEGDVINISVRATTILTNENVSIIVPNSEFISSRVINWSHNDRNIRFDIPVGVSYKEDPEEVREVLIKVAQENEHVLKHPAPHVFFDEFADSSLNFTLAIWTSTHTDKPRRLKTELYFEIFNKFKEKGIEIPFPQRDVYIKSNVEPMPLQK
ncbi:Mechanosensitive ion channel [Ekhidna lutea]|uniref:Mechanosensitive ion channel n=1 Tax=Ekhidna lutea TaxID=447679 RepID=A0A239M1I5_EKHLU|nr:mechanosensitive ion channel domain-containing protein [Ekhidna lutea]SNT35779.1 Mechanosensitive ion channel [Ekhidna lutea]